MSLAIRGMGWVTPLGNDVSTVWERLLSGEEAVATTVTSPFGMRAHQTFQIPQTVLAHPRLRRSSAISRFAVAAGLTAIEDAGLTVDADIGRMALIFATSNGGVIYTKRFYHDIVESGPQGASPLLFPETVFNAPASHLAAILGLNGAGYTLVGDGAVGALAMKMAEDLMQNKMFDYCLVVAAEEVDWVLCDAYAKWRLLRSAPPIEPFSPSPRGMILSEGAGAILLGRTGPVDIEQVSAGGSYTTRKEAGEVLRRVFDELNSNQSDLIIGSANGTFIDLVEYEVLKSQTASLIYTLKPALGESVGVSAIWQTIVGAQALLTHQLPPVLHTANAATPQIPRERTRINAPQGATILTCGLSEQVAGLRLNVAR